MSGGTIALKKYFLTAAAVLCLALSFTACGGNTGADSLNDFADTQIQEQIENQTNENNAAVEELLNMMKEGPVTVQMDDYSGFEKVGPLGKSLTASNSQTTTAAGDIVLYNGNNIVMFYGSNSWSYTRIGKIEDLSDWEKALGSGSITAVFTLADMP